MLGSEPMTDDPWQIGSLDLDGYLARLGVARCEPGRAALDELYEAHVRTFTFDNIDVLLGNHPGVGLDAVQAKFVGRGRGGYCFEHSSLLAAVLERLGYRVERHLGRVGDPPRGRTHMVVWVDAGEGWVLADPGFGMSVVRPIALGDGVIDDYLGWSYRVRRITGERVTTWELARWRAEGWEKMHVHDELPVIPVDVTMGHHFTSTFPSSYFRHELMVARHLPGRHVTLTHDTVTIRRPGEPTEQLPVGDAQLPGWLDELAVPLTSDERERLLARVAALRTADRP